MEVLERIKQQVEENPILLYMKGTPDFPQCGFSGRATQVLQACGVEFASVNIFEDPEVRENMNIIRNGQLSRNFLLTVNWSAVVISYWRCMRKVSCRSCLPRWAQKPNNCTWVSNAS